MNKVLITYVPVIHEGYIELFNRHRNAQICFVLGDIADECVSRREIRALSGEKAAKLVGCLNIFRHVLNLNKKELGSLRKFGEIIVANDEVTRAFAIKYLSDKQITWDTSFLRWDSESVFVKKDTNPDRISNAPEDIQFLEKARNQAANCSDWWRQIGILAIKNGKIIAQSANRHLPTDMTPYIDGDPRDVIEAGKNPEISTALHAERSLIAEVAKSQLNECDIYITTFPCPVCAQLLAASGVRRIFYESGHVTLDSEKMLRAHKIELVQVKKIENAP